MNFTVVKTSLICTEIVCEAQGNECLWRTLVPGGQSGVYCPGPGRDCSATLASKASLFYYFVQLQEVEFLKSEGETQLI